MDTPAITQPVPGQLTIEEYEEGAGTEIHDVWDAHVA